MGNPFSYIPNFNSMGNFSLNQPNPLTQYLMQSMGIHQQPIKVPQVNGKKGADAYDIPASSEILLMDETDPIIWYVKTDDAGLKTITGLDISIHEDEEQKTIETLEARIKKLEEEIKKRHEPDYVDVTFEDQ